MTSLTFIEDLGVCGSFTYTLNNQGGGAYDTGLFTFDSSTPTISVYTTDPGKVNTYNLDLTGTLGLWGSQTITLTFIIDPSCWDSLITVDYIGD